MNTFELDRIYIQLLRFGLINLQNSILGGNINRAKAEIDMLHNIPSLIGEKNIQRHEYH